MSNTLSFEKGVFLLLILCMSAAASANNDALLVLLKALHADGTIDTATYELVMQVATGGDDPQPVKETGSESIREVVREEIAAAGNEQPAVNNRGKFTVESADKDFSFRVGGRIQMDAATYSEDRLRHNDGTEIRRARLFAEGTLWQDWAYKLQYDFTAAGLDGIQDAYIDYLGFENWEFRIGHFREPFSLQNMTSSKYTTFMERGLPYLFTPGRNLGAGISTGGKQWSFSAGVFGEGRDGSGKDNDEGFGTSGRFTFSPFMGESFASHLGLSASYRATGSEDGIRFRERPESHVTDTRLVDTGSIDIDDYSRFAAEAALIYGPFSVAGEYYHTFLNRDISSNPDLEFSGYYLEAGWFLTGESMNYQASSGSFGKITPGHIAGKSGYGAWQIAARLSNLDLTDEDITGGEITDMTLGLNWFATPNIRFTANYVSVLEVDGGPAAGDNPDIFQIRTQVEF